MSELSADNWMAIIGGGAFLISGIATFLFGRISVKHIEAEMAKEGLEPPVWDKGIGGRVTMYAIVIVTNKAAKHSLVDDKAILRHTRTKDKKLAWLYVSTMISFFIVLIVFYFFFAPDNV